jgi:nucleotide-binding universal stress UspA family protein
MKIAAGIDFSTESELAAEHAVELARVKKGEVVLVHIVERPGLPVMDGEAIRWSSEALAGYRAHTEEVVRHDRRELGRLRERLGRRGVTVSEVTREGFPDDALCAAATELGADLVVVGTHGRTGLRWFFLGSVAQRVVRGSPVEVLVARGRPPPGHGYRRMLVATDFSASSARALDAAIQLAAPEARIDVLHCLELPLSLSVYSAMQETLSRSARDAITRDLDAAGESLVAAHRRPGLDLSFRAHVGPPALGIIHQLEAGDFELAVVGSHGRRGIRRALLGSVAEAVVRRAPCSVLVARSG